MKHISRFAAVAFLMSSWAAAPGPVAGKSEGTATETELFWPSAGAPSSSRPAAGKLPEALAIGVPDEEVEALGVPADPALETRAAVAATWTARKVFDVFGRREIYRAGFYDGLHAALRDPILSQWEYSAGLRAGRRDRQARPAGAALAPQPETLVFAASRPAARAPRIVEVFDEYPVSSSRHIEIEPLPDPWRLYNARSYDDFYDREWTDPRHAFDVWLRQHEDRAFWRGMESAERARLAELFQRMYPRQLSDFAASFSEQAYGLGHDDGWDYGSLIAHEWSFRRGYHEGFSAARAEKAADLERPAKADAAETAGR